MTQEKKHSEPLDIDKIEEELKQISPWPWRFKDDDFQGSGDIFPNFVSSRPICNITAGWVTRVDLGNGISDGVDALNGPFIAQAPERIAALVKEVKELRTYLYEIQNASKELLDNISPILNACGMDLPASYFKLKRGSDEV